MGTYAMLPSTMARARGLRAPQQRGPRSREELLAAQEGEEGRYRGAGDRATADYEHFAQNFDASQAMNEYARGAYGQVSTALGDLLDRERDSAAGAGRLETGFYDRDRGKVIQGVMNDFTNNLSTQALSAAGMQASVKQNYGAYGERARGTATDLLMSRREEVENAAREEAARKRAKKRGIAGAIGGVLGAAGGFVLGGPAGAYGGWQAGTSIGQGFGS